MPKTLFERMSEAVEWPGRSGMEAKVPCNGCRACCWDELIVLCPDEGDDADQFDTDPLPTSAGVDESIRVLRHRPDGACQYLGPLGCSIYARRPAMCRAFDCRTFALTVGLDQALSSAKAGDQVMAAALERLTK